jgi:hypothetical protein
MKICHNVGLLVLVFGLISPTVWAWSANGHGDIAVAALDRLPNVLQDEYRPVLMSGPWVRGDISWRTAAARASAWPDRVRDMPVRKLFGQYGSGKVPGALHSYRKLTTSDWHYTNALFIDASGQIVEAAKGTTARACPPSRDGKLLTVWPDLLVAYEQSTDPRDKAIILAFLLHMAADAYQPLHLMGSLDSNCRHDRGGNAFCVAPVVGFKAGLRCRDSLHFLWDQGFGVFAGDVQAGTHFRGDVRDLSVAITQVRRIAPQVYPRKSEQPTSTRYKSRSQRHVADMAEHASAHLAASLEFLAKNPRRRL